MVRTRGSATFKKRRGLRSSTGVNLQDIEDEEHIDGGSKMIDDDTNRDKGKQIETVKDVEIDKDAWISKMPGMPKKGLKKTITKKWNESCSSHAIVLSAKKRKLDKNEGRKVKKVKANKDKKIVIHRQESAIVDGDVHMVQRGFKTCCRPFHLVEMIKKISDDQIKAVKEIGFGGLLSLKIKWRSHFGLMGENDQIPLSFLESTIPLLIDGGEEFRQLFIMHAFSSFLAPTSNRTVDLRIVKCLVDVNQIRTYDWSKYVLDRLCEAVKSCKEGNIEWFCGCVLMLEIIYFHRLRFRNVVLNSTIPLIQHWTDVDIRDIITKEKLSKGFGVAFLSLIHIQ
ncbi:uncharacterized protein LOC110738461 [Chenopodium quinoa]|uniref:uncharacterized protein LOC110738461 n=1 Tax=Chenopodium quinoa TaxID=63459 RepID=UPI000B794953|nr:uncharacterized protein LOC110738461 [Chenopodium quinoa]